jgi:hypothetical protein
MAKESKVENGDTVDMNRDPITGAPGSHPLGTGVGATAGAAAGAAIGALFGPIGVLVGGAAGAVAGGGAGHAVGEQIDPTGETEYWRDAHVTRPYYRNSYHYDNDYLPAYQLGWESRGRFADRGWDDEVESDLKTHWEKTKNRSSLKWNEAKEAVRDSWDRADRTYNAYDDIDGYYQNYYRDADYYDADYSYDDYRPAYRYGTYARLHNSEREWDDRLEDKLQNDWSKFKSNSRLSWEKAKHATKDAWHRVERTIPGDADNDGR